MNFVCLVFKLGDKTLTLSPMENLMVECNHHPMGNGQVERFNQTLIQIFIVYWVDRFCLPHELLKCGLCKTATNGAPAEERTWDL